MKSNTIRLIGLAMIPLLGGCQAVGATGSLLGSVLQLGMYLVAIAAPILLSYYLATGKNPFHH